MGFFLLFTAFYGFFQLNFSLLIFSILFDNSHAFLSAMDDSMYEAKNMHRLMQ